jgi:hypothetical protein
LHIPASRARASIDDRYAIGSANSSSVGRNVGALAIFAVVVRDGFLSDSCRRRYRESVDRVSRGAASRGAASRGIYRAAHLFGRRRVTRVDVAARAHGGRGGVCGARRSAT